MLRCSGHWLVEGPWRGSGMEQVTSEPCVGPGHGRRCPSSPILIFPVSCLLRSKVARAHLKASTSFVGVCGALILTAMHSSEERAQRKQSRVTHSLTSLLSGPEQFIHLAVGVDASLIGPAVELCHGRAGREPSKSQDLLLQKGVLFC